MSLMPYRPNPMTDAGRAYIRLKESHDELLRRIRRTAEMSAGIMRNAERTGGWEGAERVARQFDRIANLASTPGE